MDLRTLRWADDLCDFFAVPPGILPEIRPSVGDFGEPEGIWAICPTVCRSAGSRAISRPASSARGASKRVRPSAPMAPGRSSWSTPGARSSPSTRGLVTTLAATLGDSPPQYALEGSVFIAGAAVQWFRDGLKAVGAAHEVDRLSESADPASGVLFVPALTGLGAPYWEPEARGTLFGLTRATSIADLARATLEGVAFQILDLIDAMNADLPVPLRELRVDGGMARSDPFLQFQADLLGLPIQRSPQTESTALGAALLAGLGVGLWPDPQSAVALLQDGGLIFTPQRGEPWRTAALSRWRSAVETVRATTEPKPYPSEAKTTSQVPSISPLSV